MRRVNNSEMETFKRCRRKWDLSYLQGWEPDTRDPRLALGTVVHQALHEHYTGGEALSVLLEEDTEEEVGYDLVLAHRMVEGYLEWLDETGADAGLEVAGSELGLTTELLPGIELHGTLDLLIRDSATGETLIFDHKTTQSFDQLANRRMQMSPQLLTYATLLRANGQEVHGVEYNMLRKVKRTGTAKPPFYQRERVHFNTTQLRAHWGQMQQTVRDMLRAEEEGTFYPTVDQDCTWKCPYQSICPMFDDGSDVKGVLEGLYVKKSPRY